jgi:hypothetical protein
MNGIAKDMRLCFESKRAKSTSQMCPSRRSCAVRLPRLSDGSLVWSINTCINKHTPSGLNFPYACPEPVLVKLISFRFRYKNGSKKVVFRTSIAFVVILSTILQWLSIPCTQ